MARKAAQPKRRKPQKRENIPENGPERDNLPQKPGAGEYDPRMGGTRDEKGRLLPGAKGGPGRPRGSRNVVTAAMQDMVSGVMDVRGEEVQADIRRRVARRKSKEPTPNEARILDLPPAMAYLLEVSRNQPGLFTPLVAKLMPAKIDVDVVLQADAIMEVVEERRRQLSAMRGRLIEAEATEVDDND